MHSIIYCESAGNHAQQTARNIWLTQVPKHPGSYIYFCISREEFDRLRFTGGLSRQTSLLRTPLQLTTSFRLGHGRNHFFLVPVTAASQLQRVCLERLFNQRVLLLITPDLALEPNTVVCRAPFAAPLDGILPM